MRHGGPPGDSAPQHAIEIHETKLSDDYRAALYIRPFAGEVVQNSLCPGWRPVHCRIMIIGSPAIPYGDKLFFRLEEEYARRNEEQSVNLFLGIGGEEETKTGTLSTISVADFARLASIMDSRRYKGMSLISRIFDGNDHFEVTALTIQAGLKSIYIIIDKI